jgi:hypothetical protein
VLIPLDVSIFAQHGLDQYRATEGGALAYTPRLPSIGGALVTHSRLALKGWTRTTLHQNLPFFSASSLYARVDPAIRADVRTLFRHFADSARRHGVPVTAVLLPSYDQVIRGATFAMQDALAEEARQVGFDVCDVREAFRVWRDRPALFIPDKHFSDTGNCLLLSEVLAHVKKVDPGAADLPDPAEVCP